jgi:hypothetical protein
MISSNFPTSGVSSACRVTAGIRRTKSVLALLCVDALEGVQHGLRASEQ